MPGNELVQALGRGLDLLRLLAESEGGMKLADIVAATGLKQPTAHNLLRTLASREFVANDAGVYRVGPALHLLAAEAASGAFLKQAEAAALHLSKLLPDATVSFCEPVGGEMLVRFPPLPRPHARATEREGFLPLPDRLWAGVPGLCRPRDAAARATAPPRSRWRGSRSGRRRRNWRSS